MPAQDPLLEDDEEPAAAKRVVAAVTKDMWSQMLRTRGFGLQDGKLTRSPSKSQAPPRAAAPASPSAGKGTARERADDDDERPQAKPSVLASFRRTQSFAPQSKDASTPKPRPPFGRMPSSAVFAAPPVPGVLAQGGADLPVASSSSSKNAMLFLMKSLSLILPTQQSQSFAEHAGPAGCAGCAGHADRTDSSVIGHSPSASIHFGHSLRYPPLTSSCV